ncbi:formate/nitrite transporter family protein [Halorarum salinum]|uniref:Formate/nitrite transporter family protein n=1 Tax=Halorarum salinum TaxID=2743089 RepID=A0A7D5LC17_9EURY|nr:formate/nitrite transporter family protein [Halobaculum salinum]QLG62968.1 formate/nitrite transporter family protein [Halobaculum salinum]
MGVPPTPSEVFERAVEEGERRLGQSTLELVATSFIAGFTIVFGIVALGIVEAAFRSGFGAIAGVAGALAFGPGVVFLVVGRAELFNENFFDPMATAVERDGSWLVPRLLRLWVLTFAFNVVGGALLVGVLSVEGALPAGTGRVLAETAAEIAHRPHAAEFVKAITGGALVSLLSFMLASVDGSMARIAVAYVVGVLLTLGPFDHVVVTVLHVLFGVLVGAEVGVGALAATTAVTTAGNLVGGLGLVTLSHVAQIRGERGSRG